MERYEMEQKITGQLDPGEGLVWSGAPSPGRMALSALPASVVGIPFTAFAAYWMYMAYTMTAKSTQVAAIKLFPLFGIPFILIGLGMLTAPLWAFLAAGRTFYAVTNKRAIIVSGGFSQTVHSYPHSEIHELHRVERAGGSGDLFFASRMITTSRGGTRHQKIGFLGIPDVRSVEQLIRARLQEAA